MLYLIGAIFQGLGIVMVQPFALRVLSNDVEWGYLIVAVSIVQVGVIVAAAGLPLAITRAWFDDIDGKRKARAISGFLSLTGMLLGMVAATSLALLARFTQLSGVEPFVVALLIMGALASVLGAQALLRAQERPLPFVLLGIGSSIGAHITGLLAIIFIDPTALVYLLGFGMAVTITTLISLFIARPLCPRAVNGAVRDSLSIGIPVLPHTAALILLTQGAVLMLVATSGPVVSGNYGKVQPFILGTIAVLGALNNAWVPRLMSASAGDRAGRLKEITSVSVVAAGLVVILASGGANLLTHVLTNGQSELIVVAVLLPLSAFGYVLYLNATTILFIERRTNLLALVTPAVVLAGGLLALIPAQLDNLHGVAIVNVSAYLLLGLTYFLIARSYVAEGWSMRLFFVSFVSCVAYVGVFSVLPKTIFWGFVEAGCLTIIMSFAGVFWLQRKRHRGSLPVPKPGDLRTNL